MNWDVGVARSPDRPLVGLSGATILVLLSVAVGLALASASHLAYLPIAAIAGLLLLVDGRARILLVLVGGLYLLQRESELTTTKLAFLAAACVAFTGAFLNLRTLRGTPAYELARPLFAGSIAIVAVVLLSLPVSYANGIPPTMWLRDATPYLLAAIAPVFALDAQATFTRKGLVTLLVLTGMFATFSFVIHWAEKRHIIAFDVDRIGLATHMVPAALFAYGMAAVLQGTRRRGQWLLLSGLVLALLLVSGTRTNLVLLGAPLAIAFAAPAYRAMRSVRLIMLGPVVVALTLLFGIAALNVSDASRDALAKRVALLSSTADRTEDTSFRERLHQSEVAWASFRSAPFLGNGPGTTVDWRTTDRKLVSSFTLDTPLTLPAKFGLVGIAAILFVIHRYWIFLRRLRRPELPGVASLALFGYIAVVFLTALILAVFEDKGTSFGLILLLALALQDAELPRRDRSETAEVHAVR
jgi:hypothetical protein